MLRLYCLPGRWLAQLNYLFPKNYVQAVQSRRQKDSSLAHFILSTGLYLVVFVIASGSMQKSAQQSPTALAAIPEEEVSRQTSNLNGSSVVVDAPDGSYDETSRESQVTSEAVEARDKPDDGNAKEITAESSPILASAIHRAWLSGKPQRFRDGPHEGYAVPSDLSLNGCRNVYYSLEQRGADWKSPIQQICN